VDFEVMIRKQLSVFELNVAFSCNEGRLLAIVGPSGAGKTTIIRIIAGLERPDQGSIRLMGKTWMDTSSKINLPTRKRGIGYVFQEFTLFPNLSVFDNAAFAARDKMLVNDLLYMFDILHLKTENPIRSPVENASGAPSARPSPASPGCSSWTSPSPPWTP
jgi:molybdate transport system ATP-binding protein